jgi:hypothetical protein
LMTEPMNQTSIAAESNTGDRAYLGAISRPL